MVNDLIQEQASKLILEETMRLDMERVREDFMGLYADIVKALSRQDSNYGYLLYEYTGLMEQEQRFFSPESGYEAGLCSQGTKFERMFMKYISDIYLEPQNLALLQKRDNLFYKICGLLGDASGLMSEFNDLYRECNGIISRNIDQFFLWGLRRRMDRG